MSIKDLPWWLQVLFSVQDWDGLYKALLLAVIVGVLSLFLWFPQLSKTNSRTPPPVNSEKPTATVTPIGVFSWDSHWGTTTARGEGTIYLYALQTRARNVSNHAVYLKDAYVTSGKTGQRLDMRIEAGSDGWLLSNQTNPIPPNAMITYRVEFNPPKGLSAEEFMRDWGIVTLTAHYDDDEHVQKFNEPDMAKIFEAFGINPLGPRVTKRSDEQGK